MTRVLVVASDLGLRPGPTWAPGGLQSMGRMIVRALVDGLGQEQVTAWSLLDSVELMRAGMPHVVGRPSNDIHHLVESSRGFGGSRLRMAVALWRARRRFDHVLFVHVGVGSLARLLPRGRHGLWLVGIESWRPLTGARRACVEGARPLLSISAFTADRLQAENAWAPRATVVHLGLEPDPPWADTPVVAAKPAITAARPPLALVVGRQGVGDRPKGYSLVIEAWPAVRARIPDAQLHLVGDGAERPALEALASSLEPPGSRSIHFLGSVPADALHAQYALAGVFVLPSLKEGFGLVHLEAMRAGLPSICSRDASAEIVVDGVTGRVVDPNPTAVAEALIELLADRDLGRRYGEAGRQRLAGLFTYDEFRKRFLAALRDAGWLA